MRKAVADRWRFDRKVVRSPTCLWWVGAISDDGYGRFATGTGRVMSAHRWLWEQDVGPLPAGVRLRHCCDETSCVRLAHLIPGSHRLNMGDITRRGRAGGPHHHGRADIRGPGWAGPGHPRRPERRLPPRPARCRHHRRRTLAPAARTVLRPRPQLNHPGNAQAGGRGSCPSPTTGRPRRPPTAPSRGAGDGASGRAVVVLPWPDGCPNPGAAFGSRT